jgi:hypothetical protein
MTQDQEQWTAVDRYITDLFVPFDSVLEVALQASDAAGLPPHNVSPNQGKLLLLIQMTTSASLGALRRKLRHGSITPHSHPNHMRLSALRTG